MKKLIFLVAVLAVTGIFSCGKKDLPKPVPKQASHCTLKPIMDPSGHHYYTCPDDPANVLKTKLWKQQKAGGI